MSESPESHWEHVYESRPSDEVSWFQAEPATSLRLIEAVVGASGSVVDIGAGTSSVVDLLVADGFVDVTVVEVSGRALEIVRERLAGSLDGVTLVHTNVLDWVPGRTFDVWHDRAVFHFLIAPEARSLHVQLAEEAVVPGGSVVIATFAPDGPTHCSGLPVCRYDADALAAEFSGAFDLIRAEREVHITPAGVAQPFTWAVFRHL